MAQKPGKNRRLVYGLYAAGLIVLSLIIYSTLFVKAFPTVKDLSPDNDRTTLNEDSESQSESQDPVSTEPVADPEPEYTTYPDTGETVATVLIDSGHGGFDGGNTAEDGTLEKDINLAIGNKVVDYLRQLNPQIEVKTIRTDDNVPWASTELEDLNYRLEQQSAQEADYFISLHSNAYEGDSSVKGFVFYINPNDPTMSEMTEAIKKNLEEVGWSSYFSTIDYEKLQVVSMSNIHSMLIELGFMTNPEDLAQLKDPEMQDKCAKAIAAAISDYIMSHPDAPAYVSPDAQAASSAEAQPAQ